MYIIHQSDHCQLPMSVNAGRTSRVISLWGLNTMSCNTSTENRKIVNILKSSKNLGNIFENFLLKITLKIGIFEILKFCKFSIFNVIFKRKSSEIFSRFFRTFQTFRDFRFHFSQPSLNEFSRFFFWNPLECSQFSNRRNAKAFQK